MRVFSFQFSVSSNQSAVSRRFPKVKQCVVLGGRERGRHCLESRFADERHTRQMGRCLPSSLLPPLSSLLSTLNPQPSTLNPQPSTFLPVLTVPNPRTVRSARETPRTPLLTNGARTRSDDHAPLGIPGESCVLGARSPRSSRSGLETGRSQVSACWQSVLGHAFYSDSSV